MRQRGMRRSRWCASGDTSYKQGIIERLFFAGRILVVPTDASVPAVVLRFSNPKRWREEPWTLIAALKQDQGVTYPEEL